MEILLLFPPPGSITHSYSSLPALTGYLRSLGHEVSQCDIGIRAVDGMLTPAYLGEAGEKIEKLLNRPPSSTRRGKDQKRHRESLQTAGLFVEDVIGNIEDAKSILRSKDRFYQTKDYLWASNIVKRAYEVLGAIHFPTEITYHSLNFGEPLTLDRVYALSRDEGRNPYLKPLRDFALPSVTSDPPPVVGISITFYPQTVPGFGLARLIKQAFPKTHVVVGGEAITYSEKRIRRHPDAFKFVDSYVFGEG